MRATLAAGMLAGTLAGCATTTIQPLTQTSFNVTTTTGDFCGEQGAQTVANRAAAIEVIRRGGDLFVIDSADSGNRLAGATFTAFAGLQTYQETRQELTVRMVDPDGPNAANALSARGLLGTGWEQAVAEGVPRTCND